ncbi:hypothetical protein FKP32DRAFT_1672789 [Trametes sanguinea]|nr:hypothetical protein FKP32DRAFT_1672789 [Trametes sanguinea]
MELVARQVDVISWIVTDVTRLRAVLRDTSAIVAGDVALVLFEHGALHGPTIHADIYTPHGEILPLITHLTRFEFYHSVGQYRVPHEEAKESLNYLVGTSQVVYLKRGAVQIRLIESSTIASSSPLTSVWTTLLMNFVTADGALCAYPGLTFRGRGLIHMPRVAHTSFPTAPNGTELAMVNSYFERGYELAGHPTDWDLDDRLEFYPCNAAPSCPAVVRFLGDKHCLCWGEIEHVVHPTDYDWLFNSAACPRAVADQ